MEIWHMIKLSFSNRRIKMYGFEGIAHRSGKKDKIGSILLIKHQNTLQKYKNKISEIKPQEYWTKT